MLGATIVYSGFGLIALGALLSLRRRTRGRGALVALAGITVAATGFLLPAPERRRERVASHLDELLPRWQFHEVHTARVAAPPERVFAAIREVRADEIALFKTLTWIRRCGRELPESILNAGDREPILDVATRSGFVWLADDEPRELVVGTAVIAPRGTTLTPDAFRQTLPPGFALAAMNFTVTPDANGGSIVSTETRVYANDPRTTSRFRAYWRVIYPGSAIIRRMWLRAIERRATA